MHFFHVALRTGMYRFFGRSLFKTKTIAQGIIFATAVIINCTRKTAYAYNESHQAITETQSPVDISETRTEIVNRVHIVCSKLGMTQKQTEGIISEFFPHLKDTQSLSQVIKTHQKIAGTLLAENGPAVFIDHTLLKADATKKQVEDLCNEAKAFSFGSVCVNGSRVELANQLLKGTNVSVAAVVGFPLGASTSDTKRAEAIGMWQAGCEEIDVVLDVGKMKDGDYVSVRDQIQSIVQDSKQFGTNKVVKVIFETCLLDRSQIIDASILCVLAGATVVKTSTGFSTAGAKIDDVHVMRLTVGNHMGVKASGGVRDKDTMMKMIHGGASLIGTSSGVGLCKGETTKKPNHKRPYDHCFETE